ncbi:hypothetical protein IAR55_003136 [Kwoniella newhampshirensis]|uniref:Beta-lactamase-related domain-containing protein n=1 Tax=Kwoniella newhampshirensis TaxID=1651941 RepID=A0AAW0YYB0_9TREE
MALPLPTLAAEGEKSLDDFLSKEVGSREIPALFIGATNAKEEIYFSVDGEVTFGEHDKGKVTEDTTLSIFSMTKFITTIACLQLVDQGLIDLEDYDLVERFCPEIGELQILEGYTEDGKEILRSPKSKINLMMLLSHVSGMAYGFNSPDIVRWNKEHGTPGMVSADASVESFRQPLIFEPGTKWNYSIGLDWAGILISRLTGKSLEALYKEKIFQPCGMKSTSFYPTDDIKARMMTCCTRDASGKIIPMSTPAMGREMDASKIPSILAGGAGLFGTARDYLSLLRNVLASASADPQNSNSLISPESFKLLFTDVIPQTPQVKACLAIMAKNQNVHDPVLVADGKGNRIGHSPGLFLNFDESVYGRKAFSGCWDGAAKTMFWIDPATGIGAVCCTNLLSQNPDPFNGVFNRFERTLYDALKV